MAACCKEGFAWKGKPTGKETTLGNNKAYVAGTNKDVAIMIVHDILGWTSPNPRLLADHFAKEADATVYLPDFFDGEVVDPDMMEDEEKRKKLDLGAFLGRHGKEQRLPEMTACAESLRKQYKKVGAIGYCYGGWACFQLGAKGKNLVDCISMAHPSLVEDSEMQNVGVPVQILACETDQMFPKEKQELANKIIPGLGLEYDYQYFPGLSHGFAARGDPNDPKQKRGLERAKNMAVCWFSQQLHG